MKRRITSWATCAICIVAGALTLHGDARKDRIKTNAIVEGPTGSVATKPRLATREMILERIRRGAGGTWNEKKLAGVERMVDRILADSEIANGYAPREPFGHLPGIDCWVEESTKAKVVTVYPVPYPIEFFGGGFFVSPIWNRSLYFHAGTVKSGLVTFLVVPLFEGPVGDPSHLAAMVQQFVFDPPDAVCVRSPLEIPPIHDATSGGVITTPWAFIVMNDGEEMDYWLFEVAPNPGSSFDDCEL